MLNRLRSGWLWVMTAARLAGDLTGLRVIIAANGLAQKVGTATLLFLFFFKMAGPIGALLVAGLAFVLVHTFYELKAKKPDELPDLPEVDRELRESLRDFNQSHRDLAEISRSKTADKGR
jgi:hypothetical protein